MKIILLPSLLVLLSCYMSMESSESSPTHSAVVLRKAQDVIALQSATAQTQLQLLQTRAQSLQSPQAVDNLAETIEVTVKNKFNRKHHKVRNHAIGTTAVMVLEAGICYFYAKNDTKWWHDTVYPITYYTLPAVSAAAFYRWYQYFSLRTPDENDYLKALAELEKEALAKSAALSSDSKKNE